MNANHSYYVYLSAADPNLTCEICGLRGAVPLVSCRDDGEKYYIKLGPDADAPVRAHCENCIADD